MVLVRLILRDVCMCLCVPRDNAALVPAAQPNVKSLEETTNKQKHKRLGRVNKCYWIAWASAHRRKWGQLNPTGKMDEKLKSVNMQKREQSGQADVANGAMLATYLFRYTSECIIS